MTHVSEEVAAADKNIDGNDVAAELGTIDSDLCADSQKPILLIIDDNKDIQKLVGTLLDDTYNIITASNGKEGLKMAARYVPDLVICDVMMPVMDGLQCCRCIKNEVSTSHIPVLMLTACSMDEQRVQAYDSGADGYISKPFSSAVLRARCAALIANRKRIRELWQGTSASAAPKDNSVSTPQRKEMPSGDIDDDFYRRFLAVFKVEMGNSDLSVDLVASRLGLERSQFYRKIKALTNNAPVELMRRLRLQQGRTLLVTTDKTISEIAYETGFSTPAYFTKCYRDTYGETPSEVRAKLGR